MHSQRSTVQSLSETFEFDHGSSSNSSGVDQSHYWNNVLNPVDSRNLPDFLLPPTDTSAAYTSSIGHSSGGLPSWNVGGPTSSDQIRPHSSHEEAKVEQSWPDSFTSHPGPSLGLEERRFEPSSVLSLESVNINLNSNQVTGGSWYSQGSTSSDLLQNTNLNTGFVGNGAQVIGPHPYKPGGSEAEQMLHSTTAVDPCASASGTTVDYLAEAGEARQVGSLDGQRLSCKRKALEAVSGQSSLGASPSFFQRAECSAWHPVSARHNTGSSLSISSGPVEQSSSVNPREELMNQRLGGGTRTLVTADNYPAFTVAESSQRNFRMRINPGLQQDSTAPNSLWVAGGNVNPRRAPVWSSHQTSRVPPFNHLVEPRAAGTAVTSTSASSAPHLPTYPRSLNPYSFHGASSSRVGSASSSPVISGERAATFREEVNSRTIPRSISEHPMFVPVTDVRSLSNGNMNAPANVASSSRASTSAGGIPPASGVTWIAHHSPPPHHPRRLSEIVRRSLFPASDSGAQSSSFPPVGPPGPTSPEMLLSSGSSHHGGNQHSYLRSSLWMDRQGDGVLGVPLSLRTLAAVPEGRSRLATEIRNVLDLVRRGENIRFEDVVILDQSVFYGVADLHDRHRDMRLDVDNMSYEELLALEERIGNVNTGLSEETVLKCLKQRTYALVTAGETQDVEPCCICQEEYVGGVQLGTLDCGHDFHSACIRQWLMLKNLCPICKTTALVQSH
ncbi:probable E3 ubiquitin-protein ligase HIP1 [Aristolochia californica]|uniref:probable E3 ubiquitin-protein ligase HIP1 n=1 Tax=Aristolochia californica TaxID=171875 RepID=UPI0035D78D11